MEPAEAEAIHKRLKLLCESDRLLGLKDWPVRRSCSASTPFEVGALEDTSAVAKRTSKPAAGHAVPKTDVPVAKTPAAKAPPVKKDAGWREWLEAVSREFPPQLEEPPGADAANRPDSMFSAEHALKGSPLEVVRQKAEALAEQAGGVKTCQRCGLYKVSTQSVFGIGHPDTRIVFVGEAPGAEEDKTGYPFVGRAGQLLTAMIEKGMGLRREHVYICNVIKHRPPENRTPATDEIAACQVHLWRQLATLEPEIIVALGSPATQTLLSTKASLGSMRGQTFDLNLLGPTEASGPMAKCVPTYHPAYLLRNPVDKKKAWEDLKRVMILMNIPSRS